MSSSSDRNPRNLIAFIPNADLYDLNEAPYLWNIDRVNIDESRTTIFGWGLPHGGLIGNTNIVANGRAYETIQRQPEGVYAQLYPWCPNAAFSAFMVEIPHDIVDIRNATEVSISCVPKSGPPPSSQYTLDFLVNDLSYVPPPEDIAARIGVSNSLQYVIYGRSIYRGFEKALAKNFRTSFADYQTIMDWGCGSARITRHVLPAIGRSATLVGFDIDEYAVNWSNINVGRFFNVCSTNPPLGQASASVDVVYAYSVFTHLATENMRIWVEEMARVLKPGGIGLFTVLSDRAMVTLHPNLSRSSLKDWNLVGVYDSAQNAQLESIGVSGDYYRNVWCKRGFLDDVFAKHFDTVDFIGHFHFYQDLLVVRRR
jgi:SAM-dependent methyltransferase